MGEGEDGGEQESKADELVTEGWRDRVSRWMTKWPE